MREELAKRSLTFPTGVMNTVSKDDQVSEGSRWGKKLGYALFAFVALLALTKFVVGFSSFWAAVVNIWAFPIPVLILVFCCRKS